MHHQGEAPKSEKKKKHKKEKVGLYKVWVSQSHNSRPMRMLSDDHTLHASINANT